MNLNNVNKVNSREWSFFNDNSKGAQNREKFLEKYGGIFTKVGRNWVWDSMKREEIAFSHRKSERKLYLFTDKEGIKYITDNFIGFCRDHNLTKSAMYDVVMGKRKQHKGFVVTVLETSK
jgi:hypothetical protein